MENLEDLLENLDSADLHALSAEEKSDLFQLLNSATLPEIEGSSRKSKITHQIEEVKEKVCQIHASLLKASGSQQVRYSHTDINTPDYSFYKRKTVQTSNVRQEASEPQRRMFTYLMVGGGAVAATYVAKTAVNDVLQWISIPADVLAMSKLEVELGEIPEGLAMTVKWRGKPVFVRHRSPEEIEELRSIDLATLRDPQHDADRTQRAQWGVFIGICSHLGCIPLANQGDYAGFYCPCHGSHYDASGRIRRGPAPLNLDVPEHNFPTDDMLVIG